MTNRRQFIKLSTSALGAIVVPPFPEVIISDQVKTNGKNIPSDDEVYWKLVRNQFPLAKDKIYLNNGTMGPSPYPVIEAVKNTMMDVDVNGNYGGWAQAAVRLEKFLKVNEGEIALTHNVTDGINIVAQGLPLKKGDEIILTTHEHVGNAFPWLNRARQDGLVIRTFTPAFTADETLKRVEALINKKTRVIAVPHIPCTTGQILPAKEITALGKSKGLFVFLDGAHGPGMIDLNLKDIDPDFYTSCTHKWMLGPKGTGFLYVKKEMLDTLKVCFTGGEADNGKWNMMTDPPVMGDYSPTAHRFYYGTQSSALYAGVVAAIEFVESIGIQNIHQRITSLAGYFQQEVMQLGDKIEMLTPTEQKSRGAVIAFKFKNIAYDKFYNIAAENKIRIRMVPENGINCVRVSSHIYNNRDELNKLLELVKKHA